MPDFADSCLHKVASTHDLLEAWIGGGNTTDTCFAALTDDFAPGFRMITPTGALIAAQAVAPLFKTIRAARKGLRISITELTLAHASGDLVIVNYIESQEWDGGSTKRRATAAFVADEDGRPRWKHLHETWV